LHEDLVNDEETRYSSVYRGKGVDDSEYEEHEDMLLDSCNTETFGGSDSATKSSIGKSNDGARTSSSSSSKVVPHYSYFV
jgi:hypothetical protein